ncbi:MAG: UDP-N-acetylmuramate--L-alanine ligase [Clostridia bacterium]|nr:UDP-N-acetylmuramate--L-alanine ligase [Clostridia bacterium]
MSNKGAQANQNISFERIRRIADDKTATVHFVGVGGVSMYSLACLTMLSGARVTGSDREAGERTDTLIMKGAKISIGHSTDNVEGASLVVYTHAIGEDNVELWEARRLGIPTVNRAEYMGAMMLRYKNRIGISGSHGKSTTVAMLDMIMAYAGVNPTVLSGASLSVGEPLKVGSEGLMIYEACEYKDSFLRFSPTVSLGLNLELDHTDYFNSIEEMKHSFSKALGKATAFSVISGDDENLRRILPSIKAKTVTFGCRENNDYRYSITSFCDRGFEFALSKFGNTVGRFELNVPGVFNVHNAVAAAVVALEYGIDVEVIKDALRDFRGIPRRLEFIGKRRGRAIYYDYAHHPTEIAASINALRMLNHEPVTVVFCPHTYSRTKSLWQELRRSLTLADSVVLTEIYPAREEPIEGVTSERLACDIGRTAVFLPDGEIIEYIDRATDGIIVLMGAGDLEKIKKEIIED